MKKMFNKAVLNGTTVMGDGLTYPRIPNVYTGDNEGGYQRGDMMDANAVVEMIKELTDTGKITIEELQNLINEEIQERVEGDQDQQRYTDEKIKNLIGTSPETLDTLKEIADALGEDPDFAANVWNKIAELTTKHNEDVQELQDAITSGFENIDFTPYVKKTDVVTDTTNGLMLASDKVKLDAFKNAEQYEKAVNLPDSVISNADISSDANSVTLKYTKDNLIDGSSSEFNMIIPAVTEWSAGVVPKDYSRKIEHLTDKFIGHNGINDLLKLSYAKDSISLNYSVTDIYTGEERNVIKIDEAKPYQAGVMSASDWIKLQSLKNYKAGNGIDITGDTISCTLDTSLYSIVTELPETGLPNKIYLLPSTKTEEGNIYTEYGYVDNKWEEIGKYKADVDLSPYSKALNLPNRIAGFDGAGSFMYMDRRPNELMLVFKLHDLINNVTTNEGVFILGASQHNAGVMSASDKNKLDGIEAGAQANKIESVSVNGTPLEITNKGVNIPIHEYTAGGGIKLENGKFSLDTIEHTERSYTTKLIGPKEEPALNIPIVDESGKLNKNILIPNVADLFNRTPTEWTGEIDDLGCIRYEDYKNISDYYYNFTKNIFFHPIQDNQLLMYNIGNGIDDDKLSDFLKNPNNYDNWNIPVAIYLSDGLLANGGLYGEVPVHDPNDDSKIYYPGGVFGFKVNIDKSKNNLLTFTEGEDYTDGFSPAIVNTKKLIVPKQSVIDTIVNSNEFKAKQDALTEAQLNNINNAITSISVNNIGQVNTNGAVNLTIPNASITENGLMSKEDKAKLDSQPTIKASNATGVTDDDYVVIKKSELNSILSRLSALENKA